MAAHVILHVPGVTSAANAGCRSNIASQHTPVRCLHNATAVVCADECEAHGENKEEEKEEDNFVYTARPAVSGGAMCCPWPPNKHVLSLVSLSTARQSARWASRQAAKPPDLHGRRPMSARSTSASSANKLDDITGSHS